jgi:hypothetical protein
MTEPFAHLPERIRVTEDAIEEHLERQRTA